MATIQVREIPEDAYETIRRRARREGRSIQTYVRELLVELASSPSKREAIDAIEDALEEWGPAGASPEDIRRDVDADRR